MKYAGKTIVTLAHERGANGNITKRDTAWKYLLSDIRTNTTPLEERGCKYRSGEKKASYRRKAWVKRVVSTGDALCHMHGYFTREESSQRLVEAGKYTEDALLPEHIIRRHMATVSLAIYPPEHYTMRNLPSEPQGWNDPDYILAFNGRFIRFCRYDSATWSGKYRSGRWPDSKKITRSAHLLRSDIACLAPHTLLTTTTDVEGGIVEKWVNYEARGNWRLKVITDLMNIAPERQRGLSHIQLDPHYRIALTRKIAGVEIWTRTLAGEVVDYCAARGKDTYHAATPREAIRGLARKIATPGTRREAINMDYALSLGYCRSGIEQFCDDYGLDADKTYSRSEIQALIVAGNGRAEKYSRELAKAGFTH